MSGIDRWSGSRPAGRAAGAIQTPDQMQAFFPYKIAIAHIQGYRTLLSYGARLAPAAEVLEIGDYIVRPAGDL